MKANGKRVAKRQTSPKEVAVQPEVKAEEAPTFSPEQLRAIDKGKWIDDIGNAYETLLDSNRTVRLYCTIRERLAVRYGTAILANETDKLADIQRRKRLVRHAIAWMHLLSKVSLALSKVSEEDGAKIDETEARLAELQWAHLPPEKRGTKWDCVEFLKDSIAAGLITNEECEHIKAGFDFDGTPLVKGQPVVLKKVVPHE